MSAGKAYKISPVFLAARVRQETGGNSPSVNGSKSGGVKVYNPFNIGAYGSNPAAKGLAYAKKMGWTTPAKSVNGGAKYLASGYINKKQNTIYFQRFNVANGLAKAGTHQYMTNIMAPYSEAGITKTSYSKMGITGESLGFIIPVYKSMPSRTKLP
jgi:beta-N-acetylglucosaminidase